MTIAIVVHGGAGAWPIGSKRLARAVEVCSQAATAGRELLAAGATAVAAVEAAVRVLEDDLLFNAGRGSHPTSDGNVEVDAMIMSGADLSLGAVAAVQRVQNPISLARMVMEKTPHTFLAGAGAEQFADSSGFPRVSNAALLPLARGETVDAHDTVGAVALDAQGNIAAATSTGGIPNKMPGRIGDSPLVGAGAYAANESAAVSATGDGEALMKILISKTACDLVSGGASPQQACETALQMLTTRFDASAGLIALDPQGHVGVTCNSAAMPYAIAVDAEPILRGHQPPSR
ncbi:MAG: isoaspartyl peptidase/L-asparaginase [Chloroflexota bacterium]|nr:isoaspartyl peptidase/L-asparaginase [Chloroflexota bacterium]